MVFLENTAADCGVYSAKEKGKERNRKMRKTKGIICAAILTLLAFSVSASAENAEKTEVVVTMPPTS